MPTKIEKRPLLCLNLATSLQTFIIAFTTFWAYSDRNKNTKSVISFLKIKKCAGYLLGLYCRQSMTIVAKNMMTICGNTSSLLHDMF